MTLEEVEGLADLIDAETESQAVQARKLLNGHLKTAVADWRAKLIHAGALLQATIDFADEEVPIDVFPEVSEILLPLRTQLEEQARGVVVSERVRSGFEVAIIGRPNSGKSTFINALARRDVAIVTDVAGTTRDVLEVDLDLRGHSVRVLDTAGIRDTDDSVEKIGIKRALERAESADLRIWLKTDDDYDEPLDMTADDLIVSAKDDAGVYDNGLSGKTGRGIDRVLNHIGRVLSERVSRVGVATLERHGIAITNAVGYLDIALLGLKNDQEVELIADDLRAATRQLDQLIGQVDVEDVLDKVFSSFCLGK
jgi:tRNA modification GTPase